MSRNNVWIDESPLASVITVSSGDPTQGSVSPNPPAVGVPYDPLVHGGSTSFDGVDDVINVAYDSNIDFGTGDFTIEFWINPQINDKIICGGSSPGTNTLSIHTSHSSFYYILIGVNSTSPGILGVAINCGSAYPNQWTHIAVSRNSGVWRAYRNGVLSSTYTNSIAVNVGTGGLFIGKGHSTDTNRYKGFIGPMRFVKGVGLYPSGTTFTPQFVLQAVSGTVLLLNHYNIGIFDSACKANLFLSSAASRDTTFKYGTGAFLTTAAGSGGIIPGGQGTFKNALGTSDWTIETWIYNSSLVSPTLVPESYIFSIGEFSQSYQNSFGGNGFFTNNLQICFNMNRTVGLIINGTKIVSSSTSLSSANVWTHIAVTRQGNVYRIFLDGVLNGTATHTGFNCDSLVFYISGCGAIYRPSGGIMDDLRVTRSVARYIANFTPPTAGLPKA